MKSVIQIFVSLLLFFSPAIAMASSVPPMQEISQDALNRIKKLEQRHEFEVTANFNRINIMTQLWPALKKAGKVGRIYYMASCPEDADYPGPFPKIDEQPGRNNSSSENVSSLDAVRGIFQGNKNVEVAEEPEGVIDVIIGKKPDKNSILQTKISHLTLTTVEQYDADSAISAIENSPEVRNAMQKLDIHLDSWPHDTIIKMQTDGLPHLPESLTDTTVDDALDMVAQTFGGVVVYGSCSTQHLYTAYFLIPDSD